MTDQEEKKNLSTYELENLIVGNYEKLENKMMRDILTDFSQEIMRKYDVSLNIIEGILDDMNITGIKLIEIHNCTFFYPSNTKTHGMRCPDAAVNDSSFCSKHQKYIGMMPCDFNLREEGYCGIYVHREDIFDEKESEYMDKWLCKKHALAERKRIEKESQVICNYIYEVKTAKRNKGDRCSYKAMPRETLCKTHYKKMNDADIRFEE